MPPPQRTLLLTACIDPGATNSGSNRADPQVRLKDYRTAIERWLAQDEASITGLLFVDNSGYDLAELREWATAHNEHGRRLEFLSFQGNDIPEGLHYGYAELGIFDHALEHSDLLRETPQFVKATGRLFFPRLPELLARVPQDFLAVADGRANVGRARDRVPYLVTTLLLFDTAFYRRELQGRRDWLTAERGYTHVENFFYHFLLPLRNDPRVRLRFPINVDPVGVSGTLNQDYLSPKARVLNALRAACRVLAPNQWI